MSARGTNPTIVVAGIVLVGLGVLFLLMEMDVVRLEFKYVAPIVLIAVGLLVLVRGVSAGPRWTKQEQPGDGTFDSMRPRRPTQSG